MRSKMLVIQAGLVLLFILLSLGSASSNNAQKSTYYGSVNNRTNSTNSYIEKTDFPDEPCHTCEGRKGYYLFDQWNKCKRCNGTGKEPKH